VREREGGRIEDDILDFFRYCYINDRVFFIDNMLVLNAML
jgi:hypothetical protein